MTLKMVSLTGADDAVDPADLVAISAAYPFVEWAILYFPEKEGTPRNPSAQWRDRALAMGLTKTAAHLCGVDVFRDILHSARSAERIADLAQYGRVQLNINARRADFTDDEVLAVFRRLHQAGQSLILQYHAGTAALIDSFLSELDEEGRERISLLFDESRGKGMRAVLWPEPHPSGVLCGYAGGLGPDVMTQELTKISGTVRTAGKQVPYYVDMESGIRTDNAFDRAKVIMVLAAAQPFTAFQVAPTMEDVGAFIDTVAGKTRTTAAVSGRLIEESVELALAAGLSAAEIMAHVADALHNQALKASRKEGCTRFPSEIGGKPGELAEECADVGLVLKDLCHVAGIDLDGQEASKWDEFKGKKFRVSTSGTIYAIKPHVN